MGHVATREGALAARLRDWRKFSGSIPGPFEAWLVHRGLETLEVRYSRMCANALEIAQRLSSHPKVRALKHPSLTSHPAHALARQQMSLGGSLIALTLADRDAAERFIANCDLMRASTSFGGVHTSAERRARWGDAVDDGFIRVSVGCEPVETLWHSIERALASV
jgi:cystathionine gamma-lyase